MRKKNIFFGLIAGLLILGISNPALSSNKRWGKNYFPNIQLTDQDGIKHRFYDDLIKDKVVAINFIFTSCGYACPLETSRMVKVQNILGERMGKDIFFYSISIDPERDTPERMKAYMKKYKMGKGWKFLTGNKKEIDNLRKKLGLDDTDVQDNPDNPNDHNISLIIGNETTGRWMKRSPFENPAVLATQLGDWLHNWKGKPRNQDSYANAPELRNISSGEKIFRSRCQSCHTIGGGDDIGPDLIGITKKRDRKWLVRWLKEPDKMLEEKDPIAMALYKQYNEVAMPNLGLSKRDVIELISYMSGEDNRQKNKPLPRITQ